MDSASGRLSAALLLLYYIQGNYAAIYDKPLFDAPFVPLKESTLPLWEKVLSSFKFSNMVILARRETTANK